MIGNLQGRAHRVNEREEELDELKELMKNPANKDKYNKRLGTAEPVFGTLKSARGFDSFFVRGLSKVKQHWSMLCTAFNLRRLYKFELVEIRADSAVVQIELYNTRHIEVCAYNPTRLQINARHTRSAEQRANATDCVVSLFHQTRLKIDHSFSLLLISHAYSVSQSLPLLLFIELSFILSNEIKINNKIKQNIGGSMENRQEQQNRQDRQDQQNPKDKQDIQDKKDQQNQQDRQNQQNRQKLNSDQSSLHVKIKLKEFIIPPINDALIIGKNAPIGSEAMRRALTLLHGAPFDMIKVEDDIVSEILVRNTILKKIQQDNFINLIYKKVKPFMSIDEVIHLDIDVEMFFEEMV
jgi:hypothetical protein